MISNDMMRRLSARQFDVPSMTQTRARRLTPDVKALLLRLHAEGLNSPEIARRLGVNAGTVRHHVGRKSGAVVR